MRDQSLEALVPTVLPGIEDAVPVDDPAHVAGLVRTQEKGFGKLEALVEDAFDGLHGLEKASLVPFGELAKHLGHLLARTVVEQGEGFFSLGGEREETLSSVGPRTDFADKALLLETGQDTA